MKSALLSKIAMCVCPPAIVATSAVTVPPVKRAVHRLTAPSHAPAARPKPRRVFSAAYDCTPTAVPLSTAAPVGMTAVAPADSTGTLPVAPTAYNVQSERSPYQPLVLNPLIPGFSSIPPTNTPQTTTPPPAPSALPEVSTWAMTITGFGAIGWALRRRPRTGDTAVEAA